MSSERKQYPFRLIEPKWQEVWDQEQTFRAWNPGETIPANHPFAVRCGPVPPDWLPKFYILDMFPYPSGAGLHVGHPEGYTATDILTRYKRARGFNVLHPMGWDAFGLPAEQYAIKTGQHPRKTTEQNIATFKRQIQALGFSYDWTREIDTTDPGYFRWTQWIFLQLYNAWFNPQTNQAEPIATLPFPPELKTEEEQRAYRDSKRLAYVSEMPVWWCEELGTVLANEEVIDGKSEVGGFSAVRKPMRQWMLRITAYAERLLTDLDSIDWSHSLKEMQRNWIGRSEGAEVEFRIVNCEFRIHVFTTRPDTLFGATYMVLAPEHKWVDEITTPEHRAAVQAYKAEVSKKSDLERTELAKEKTGVFTGAYAINPVIDPNDPLWPNQHLIPIWIADYVLASYGTGAIMAVPSHDERDMEFALKFEITTQNVVLPPDDWLRAHLTSAAFKDKPIEEIRQLYQTTNAYFGQKAFVGEGISINSDNSEISIDGLPTPEAKIKITTWLEAKGLGKKTINYKLRDWLFSRQRYWGEPFPIVWKCDARGNLYHEALPESALPLLPPTLEDYKPTPDGQPPLARAQEWVKLPDGSTRETNTMPQWAGSCWYYLRYLDSQNAEQFVGREAERYWMGTQGIANRQSPIGKDQSAIGDDQTAIGDRRSAIPSPTPGVDLYVGGTEHAVLHLLYARFWHKVLYDLGHVSMPEPFFKLVNQGLILGEDGQKMSKSRGNVINPDDILVEYGADAFRLYEMFLGPLEMVKPWNTKGVEGVYRFLGRVWRLFVDEKSETEFEQSAAAAASNSVESLDEIQINPSIQDVEPTAAQLKTLHACIKKVTEDLDGLRFNTAISALMIFVNEAMAWPVKPRGVLRQFLLLLQPFAPHLAEELFAKLSPGPATPGAPRSTLSYEPWPEFDPALLVEDQIELPVQVNGKLRDRIVIAADAAAVQIEAMALRSDKVQSFLEGKTVKKIIIVPKKMVNIVAA